ncbi:AbrB/MazE/SpoVT family DNA-binding domain-containing protein [Mobiluncus mulieris]|uniref:AbrB/MazE/SpoVT family DNA-binding domain-containing protein n=1 Tax=Mobiluncus mulieris TaxID=2052 RepID=UPI001E2C5456|nr:AbrB/MazE/SpoVT family DNA-binding domain-containing protein [Mobiluncus mulieris]
MTRLVRWGNSQAVRLPKSVLEQSGVALGDELEVRVQNGAISLQPLHTRTVTIPDFEALFAGYQGLPPVKTGLRMLGDEALERITNLVLGCLMNPTMRIERLA